MSTRVLTAATAAFSMFASVFAGHANACSYADLRQPLTAGSPAAKNAARFAASVNAAGLAVDAGALTAPELAINGGQRNLYAEDGTTFIAHLGDGTVAGARVRP